MKKQISTKEFIYSLAENYISERAKNSYEVAAIAEDMPTFEAMIISLYFRWLDGEAFPVDIEALYINSENYEPLYAEVVTLVAAKLMRKGVKSLLN